MKKRIGITIGLIVLVLSLGVLLYALVGVCYKDTFPIFTWINGNYCTGKTVEEVNAELTAAYTYDGIKVKDIRGAELFIKAEDIDLNITYASDLGFIQERRGGLYWGRNLIHNNHFEASPYVDYNPVKLNQILENWEALSIDSNMRVTIENGADGYVLVDNLTNIPEVTIISSVVSVAVSNLEPEIDLATAIYEDQYSCYYSVEHNEKEAHCVELFNEINEYQMCPVSFSIMDVEKEVTPSEAGKWFFTEDDFEALSDEERDKSNPGYDLYIIDGVECELPDADTLYKEYGLVVTSDGKPIISEAKVYDYIKSLSDTYDTTWAMNRYRSGESTDIILCETSKANNPVIDVKEEFNHFKQMLLDGSFKEDKCEDFILSKDAKVYNASEQLGNTYIEVNMKEQMLYYFVDGVLCMNMPVVTGNVNRGRGTPAGIYKIYNKRYHTYLRGADYVSYVNYWLGVYKGVGIHDANWRSKFGGDIFKRDGSHGCINCPIDSVSQLWEIVEIGTPVILHY